MAQSGASSGVRFVRWGALALALAVLFAVSAARADAATFVSGQQKAWEKEFGTGTNELFNPQMLGVDSSDGSVYISDNVATGVIRIQKFSEEGDFKGVTPSFTSTARGGVIGIAVDPVRKHFYALETSRKTASKQAAEKIVVFSTDPDPVGGELAKTELPPFPASGAEALLNPKEIAVDPSTGNLIIAAEDESGSKVIESVDSETGAMVARYTESGAEINELFGIAVDQQGITYVVTAAEPASQSEIRAFTLPANFEATSTLTPVPGFEAAATAEEWPTVVGQFPLEIVDVSHSGGTGWGPQVAVASGPNGDVLYYKTLQVPNLGSTPGVYYVHGYSVTGQATSVIYGGGSASETGKCSILTETAAFGVGPDESLAVLDQGESVSTGFPTLFPTVMRFGPGAEDLACPVPAGALVLEAGGLPKRTVATGISVALNGSGSELGGQTLSEMTWTIQDSTGATVFTESRSAPTESIDHVFSTPGTYTVRLKMKTSAPNGLGNTVSARPQTIEVTDGPVEVAPTIGSFTPTVGHAGTLVTITGTEFTNATKVEFGSTAVACPSTTAGAECTLTDATHITVAAPAGIDPGTKVPLKVTNGAGTSAASTVEFEEEPTAPPVEVAPTIGSFTPTVGHAGTLVTITGTEFTNATKVEFGSTAVACPSTTAGAECTLTDATHITVAAPAGIDPGTKVPLKVTNGAGTSAASTVEFEEEPTAPPVEVAPTIGSFTPTVGHAGTLVTITGTEFTNATKVEFGSTAVACPSTTAGAECTLTDATHITVAAPAGIDPGTKVPLKVTNGAGTSAASSLVFGYEATAIVTHKLTVGKTGAGSGKIQCGSVECPAEAEYAVGTKVTLVATADQGSTFTGWSGACSGIGSCVVEIGSSDQAVTANFDVTPSNDNHEQPKTEPAPQKEQPKTNPPSNTVKPGPVKPNSSGATVTFTVPGPGTLAASGKGVVATKVNAKGSGPVQLKIKLTGSAKKTLAKKGTLKVKVKVVFTPTGGSPGTTTKTITFKAAKAHHKAAGSVAGLLVRGLL